MVVAKLRIAISEFALVAAALLIALQVYNCALTDHLHYCAFVENVEDLELLLQCVQELGNQQDDHFLVLNQGVNHFLPVFVVVVVNEHGLNLAKVATLLFLALDELILQELDLWLHLVRLQNDRVVDAAFSLELADLRIEKLRVIVYVYKLVLGAYVWRVYSELFFN